MEIVLTNDQHLILEQLHSGPESLNDLWRHLKPTLTLQSILDALWGLQDAKQAQFTPGDGMWHIR
jgi:hypothetical protein